MVLILYSILFESSTFLSKKTSMAFEPKGTPSKMLSAELIVEILGSAADKLSVNSRMEVMSWHLERFSEKEPTISQALS